MATRVRLVVSAASAVAWLERIQNILWQKYQVKMLEKLSVCRDWLASDFEWMAKVINSHWIRHQLKTVRM